MNYLAHLTLAATGGEDPALAAGALLGDFVKGPLAGAYPDELERGMRLHRFLDACSNRDPAMRRSARRVPMPARFAPPFVDVIADHILAREFEHWHGESLERFAARQLDHLERWRHHFPPPAAAFLDRLIAHDVLLAYRDGSTIARIAGRLGERLALPGAAERVSMLIATEFDALAADFAEYYPALTGEARRWLSAGRES